jgi:hypothetical protein
MPSTTGRSERVFKTAWFARAARKAGIQDSELCSAIRQVIAGQAVDLGGGVWKKRLGRNRYRSLVLAKSGRYWVYAFLFAKKDRANIDDRELATFRAFANLFARKTEAEIDLEMQGNELMEICRESEQEIQKRCV